MIAAAKNERRRKTRKFVRWPVKVEGENGTVGGETRNISYDGIYIRCEEPLRLNENFRMAILTPDRHAIGMTGKIVWADLYGLDEERNAFGMGICLVEIAERDRLVFEDALSSQAGR